MFCAIAWNLWKWRNSFVFEQEAWSPGYVLQRIHRDVLEFQRWGSWKYEEIAAAGLGDDHVSLHTDGSWQRGADIMGEGGVIRDGNEWWISSFATTLGT